jgi:hypothetical protein
MDSAVKARPNHYEVLGLAPTATGEEIARAFAKEVSRPRAFGGLAQLSIAYETLRNPDKRRSYDASIGLLDKPEPEPEPDLAFKPYAMHATVARPEFKAQPIAEPRTAGFIAASLREPQPKSKTEPEGPPPSELMRRLEAVAMPTFQPPRRAEEPAPSFDSQPSAGEDDEAPVAWKRPAAIAGCLVAAVATIGAMAGLDAGNDAQSAQPAAETTSALPQPKTVADVGASSKSPGLKFGALDVRPEPRTRPAAAPRIERAPVARRATGLADLQLDPPPPDTSAIDAPAVEQAAVSETAATAPIAASMPLAASTVARTIGRIGYACGRVASTAAIEGEGSGVYKVTCTSGHSYRAAPVRGRYRFKRLSN